MNYIYFFKFGVRNLLKYKRRNIEIGLIVFICIFLVSILSAFMEGFKRRTFRNLIENIGAAKIYKKGFYEKEEILPLDKNIGDYDKLIREIKQLYPEVDLTPQIKIFAYLNNGDENLIAFGMGIEPYMKGERQKEKGKRQKINPKSEIRNPNEIPDTKSQINPNKQIPNEAIANTTSENDTTSEAILQAENDTTISSIHKAIKDNIAQGRFFKNNRDKGIILNKFCVKKLHLKLKDKVIILTSDVYNSFNAVELELIGILERTFLPIDNKAFFVIDLNSAQKLLGLEGKVIELTVSLPQEEKVSELKKSINKVIKTHNLEFITWQEILGVFAKVIDLAEIFMGIIYFIFILISSVGITNTVLISVFERLKDFGTLRALGLTKQDVLKIMLIELGTLGIISSLIGILISMPIIYYFSVHGIYIWTEAEELAPWIGQYFYLDFSPLKMFYTFIIGSIIPIISGIYPLIITNKMTVRELLTAV